MLLMSYASRTTTFFFFVITISISVGQNLQSGITPTCQDQHQSCNTWVVAGFCSSNQGVRDYWCRRSCGQCGPSPLQCFNSPCECRDHHSSCQYWASHRQCTVNPTYMRVNCKKSCGLCTVTDEENLADLIIKSKYDKWGRWLTGAPYGINVLGDLIFRSTTVLMGFTDGRGSARNSQRFQGHLALIGYSYRVQRSLTDCVTEKIQSRALTLGYHIEEADRIIKTRNIVEIRRSLPGVLQTLSNNGREVQNLARKWSSSQHEQLVGNAADYSSALTAHWNDWVQFPRNMDTFIMESVIPALQDLEQKLLVIIHHSRVSKQLRDSVVRAAQAIVILRIMSSAHVDFFEQHVTDNLAGLEGLIAARQLPSPATAYQQNRGTSSSADSPGDVLSVMPDVKQILIEELEKVANRYKGNNMDRPAMATVPAVLQPHAAGPTGHAGFPGLSAPQMQGIPHVDEHLNHAFLSLPVPVLEGPNMIPAGPVNSAQTDDDTLYDDLDTMTLDEEVAGPPGLDLVYDTD